MEHAFSMVRAILSKFWRTCICTLVKIGLKLVRDVKLKHGLHRQNKEINTNAERR